MKMIKIFQSIRFWRIATLILLLFFAYNQTNLGLLRLEKTSKKLKISFLKPVQANEIYPMFSCPCCGQPLNKEEPCCESMVQIVDYIDEQIKLNKTKEEIVLSTAKEYGIDRLIDENERLVLKQKLTDIAPADAPRIKISETIKDLGTISQKQGVVSTDFEFTNQGGSDLIINKLNSSCGCTSAAIVYEGNIGPRFTMAGHGQEENPTDWEIAIKPGDAAILRVFYDPTVHPDLEGAVTRFVSLFSNDPVEFEIKATISLEQTK